MVRSNPGSTDSTARIADIPWGQMTQFVDRIIGAGLTGDDVKKLLDNRKLLAQMVQATKALLAEPAWDSVTGLFYHPTHSWNTIAPGVQMKRPEGHCSCRANADHILVRVKRESCFCNTHWGEAVLVHLSDSWADIAPGVQVQKCHTSGIAVRKLKTL